MIVEQLAKCGITATLKNEVMSLDEIIEQFANPSIEHDRGF
jgi:hypothetical protein